MANSRLPAGVQDVLPRECSILTELKLKLERKFSLAGFSPVLSAGLEYYETFSGKENAVPEERMFKMTDTDGKLLVLRPDTTLSIARIAATKLNSDRARLSYFADKYDLENGGGLSSREIYQAGVECLGEEGAFSDAQCIAFAIECLKEAGLRDFIIDIGHVGYFKGLLEESGLSPFQAEDVRACINRKDTMNAERLLKKAGVSGDALNNILALPALFGGREVFSVAEALTHNSCARKAVDDLKNIDRLLTEMGYEGYISYDLGMIKPLSYYSGILFSGLVKDLGAPVLSGGRYDNLADAFGKHMPAVGFAMGLKRILVALERQGALPEEKKPLVIVLDLHLPSLLQVTVFPSPPRLSHCLLARQTSQKIRSANTKPIKTGRNHDGRFFPVMPYTVRKENTASISSFNVSSIYIKVRYTRSRFSCVT